MHLKEKEENVFRLTEAMAIKRREERKLWENMYAPRLGAEQGGDEHTT